MSMPMPMPFFIFNFRTLAVLFFRVCLSLSYSFFSLESFSSSATQSTIFFLLPLISMLFCIDCVCILISQRIDFTRNSCLLICAPRYLLFLLRLSLRFLSLSLFLPANVKFLPSHQKECNSRIKNSDVSRCFPERFLSFPLCSSLSSSLVSFCYFIFVCTN